jgi:hypothetical protein
MQAKSNGIGKLLDAIKTKLNLKNDAALSRALSVGPPVVSKLRSGELALGAVHTLRMMEDFDMSLAEIRELAAA